MRVSLVNMPWQVLAWPSLAMGVLDSHLTGLGHEVTQLYENIAFAEYLLDASGGRLTPDDYSFLSERGYDDGVGEWVFTSALHRPGWCEGEFADLARRRGYDRVDAAVRMHHLVPEYLAAAAGRVLATDPEMIGLTTSCEQNVAVLALAARLKHLRPELPIVLGGANCDGPMGAALHRNFPFLDYVVRGEGEQPLTELLDALAGRRDLGSVTALCWRDSAGRSVENPYRATMTPGDRLPASHVRPFFERIDASPVRGWVDALYTRLETSRGCWWGEKRQCTFCGLNPGSIGYRSKPAELAWREIERAVTDHGVLDIAVTDNILDPAYFDTLLPRIAEAGWDLRFFYEVKSNLKPEQVRMLAEAGVTQVQPGIESLSSGPLSIMDKGVSGAAQVRALRLFEEYGVSPGWNYIYGFPGEDWERDYAPVVAQLPALVHLQPPGNVGRLTLDRFSPLFHRPELGIDDHRAAAEWYRLVYDLPEAELGDLAYLFRYRPRGIDEVAAAPLHAAVRRWQVGYERSSLTIRAVGDKVVVKDRRVGWPRREHLLDGLDAVVYRTLERHVTLPGLRAALDAGGYEVDPCALGDLLDGWLRGGLVYRDGDTFVALAIPADPRQRNRWRHDREDADATADH